MKTYSSKSYVILQSRDFVRLCDILSSLSLLTLDQWIPKMGAR